MTQATALLLLAMSVASWVVIAWKLLFLRRARGDVVRCMAAFWQAPSLEVAQQTLVSLDREALVLPMVAALYSINDEAPARSLGALGPKTQQLTRVLRGALHGALARLQFGQVLLATVGSTAPFVGLLGTVWGIYHALTAIAGAGQISIDRVAGPVGEALVMTAAGRWICATGRRLRRKAAHEHAVLEAPLMAFGRLERNAAPQPMSDINMTPLVDVMLVLVVIFILTAPLLASAIRLDLPRADGAVPGAAPQAVTLVVDKAGQVYLEDEPLTQAELAQRLAETAASQPDAEVQLRADAAVPYGRVVEIMGAAHAAGLQRIGFVADPAAAAPSPSTR